MPTVQENFVRSYQKRARSGLPSAIVGFHEDRPVMAVAAEGKFEQGGCHLLFCCPKCHKVNSHGGTWGEPEILTHRLAHCPCWPGGYYLFQIN